MSDAPDPMTRAEFIQRFHESWNALEQLFSGYDAEQMVVPHDAAGWNVRDHLAHLCAWEATMIAFLHKEHPWEAIGLTEEQYRMEDIDASNEIIRAMTINVSPDETVEMLKETNAAFLESLDTVTDEDLKLPARDFHPAWARARAEITVLDVLWGDTWGAFDEHRPWIADIVTD